MIFKSIKKMLFQEAMKSVDLSKPLPVAKMGRGSNIVKPKKKTIITDVMDRPEDFILEAWIDKNEINVRVKRRFNYEVEQDNVQDAQILK